MRFSKHFGVTRTRSDDWFDPHLTVDTKLFVDPFFILLHESSRTVWTGAHAELIDHFVRCYDLVARGGAPSSTYAKQALSLLTFPEPPEFCLGYTAAGTRGLGGGPGVARQMANGIAVAIAAGLVRPEHIEEVGILNERIGADTISDATCNVLKARFIRYTQRIARRHKIPLDAHRIRHAQCFAQQGRWLDETVSLPTNPSTGKAVLLTPRRFLNDVPVLNADDWFDYGLNDDIRTQLNISIGQKVSKSRHSSGYRRCRSTWEHLAAHAI